jgi:hypothetical protein
MVMSNLLLGVIGSNKFARQTMQVNQDKITTGDPFIEAPSAPSHPRECVH